MKRLEKSMILTNVVLIASIFVLNFFYQLNGFDFTLKCICSIGFSLVGIINLCYAISVKASERRFYFGIMAGLLLATLGDILIGYNFILGALTFALGHACFVVAYCFMEKMKVLDLIISGVLFIGSASFLLFAPILSFGEDVFKIVCVIYALIISLMLGKAIGNFVSKKTIVTLVLAVASVLFFFSDLMLVLDWFVGRWSWTDHACMGTYYPALCLIALSMLIRAIWQDTSLKCSSK